MRADILRILFKDWLIRQAGKVLMITGVIGLLADLTYDNMVGRASSIFGPMQWVMAGWCVLMFYLGWILNGFYKDLHDYGGR